MGLKLSLQERVARDRRRRTIAIVVTLVIALAIGIGAWVSSFYHPIM